MGRRRYRQGRRSGHPVAPTIMSSFGNKLGWRRVAVTSTLVVLVAAGCGITPAPSASEVLPSETPAAPAITVPETTVSVPTITAPSPATTAGLLATTAPAPKATVSVLVGRPRPTPAQLASAPAHPPATSRPSATAQPRPLPWTIASSVPTGQELTLDVVSNQLRIGSCLARSDVAPMPWLVPCSGPHTNEVTRTEDLSARFPTMPTTEQEKAVGDELCPVALRAWIGGDDPGYKVSFGAVDWHLYCTANLANKAPFTGTLKGAASK